MEEMDFEQRRELRRQKREEMRLEAERMTRENDDEEEAARERRRRERQELLRKRESEEPGSRQTDGLGLTNSHSVSDAVSSSCGGGEDEDQALQERMAKREERRLRRMQEAQERQRELDSTAVATEKNNNNNNEDAEEEERPSSWRRGRNRDNEEEEEKSMYGSRRREQEEEEAPQAQEEAEEEVEEQEVEVEEEEEEKPRRSYMREMESTEEPNNQNKELAKEEETHSVVSESSNQANSTYSEADEIAAVASEESGEVPEEDYDVDYSSENKSMTLRNDSEEDNEANERGGAREERKQNGGMHTEAAQHRKPERTLSRGSVRSPEVTAGDDQDDVARLEAERKLEELKRRRDDAESEEFERMRQKQQESEVELEELKKKREERKKVLEEEERHKKQEEADRKAKEEEEKRKMKEEIERRRAEAAEKRQKVEDTMDGEGFKCVSPRGSSLKIGERAEFLNKSAQKSAVKASPSAVVSKIDNRLEQYTSAAQRENKESRSPRSGATDLPLTTDIRNIKSMWEKGNVFSTPGSGGSPFKEAAVMKTGVAGRINDWLNKTPESGKAAGGRPTDLKPVDVTNKRSLWENKGASPTKVAGRGVTKSVTNGMGH